MRRNTTNLSQTTRNIFNKLKDCLSSAYLLIFCKIVHNSIAPFYYMHFIMMQFIAQTIKTGI